MDRPSKQYYVIDYVKFFLAICVVAIHTYPLVGCKVPWILSIYSYVVRLAVPFFFITSGYFLYSKFEPQFSSERNIKLVERRLVSMIKIYLIWNLIYLPSSVYGDIRTGNTLIKSTLRFFLNLLCSTNNYYSGALWYILSMIYAMSFTLLLMKAKRSEKVIGVCSLLFLPIYAVVFWLADNIEHLQGIPYYAANLISKIFVDGRVFSGIGYMAIGMVCAKSRFSPSRLQCVLILLAGLLINIFVFNFSGTVLIVVFSYALFEISRSFYSKSEKYHSSVFRHSSTVIYLVHQMWIFIMELVLPRLDLGLNRVMFFLLVLTMSILTSVVVEYCRKWKIVRYIFM